MPLFILLLVFVAVAVFLAWFLISHDRGEKEPVSALWWAVGLGLGGALLAGFLEAVLIPAKNLSPGAPLAALFGAALMVGLVEEACKFVPLALVLYKKRYFNEHTDGVIYFALAGLGFGLPENILYTLQFGAQTGFLRVFLTPFFHAATTGMVGYFLAKRKVANKSLFGIWPALLAAIVLHGMYDFGLLSGTTLFVLLALVITIGMSVGLFVLFLKANEHDQDAGLSVVGHNAFCRSCGKANPLHHLYCVYCGKNA